MKILHLCRQYYPSIGGVERFVAQLAVRFQALGHSVEVVTLNRIWRRPDRLNQGERIANIQVYRVPFSGGPLMFLAPGVLGYLQRYDLIHIHNTDFFLDYVAGTRWLHGRPFVVSTHGGFFHTTNYSRLKSFYFHLLTRHSLRAAAAVIPNSLIDYKRFAPYARKAVRLDNAIDYPVFAGIERRPQPGRLITIGRLAPNKNLAVLLRVYATLHAKRPTAELVVIGDGQQQADLKALAAELGLVNAVSWLGEVSDERMQAELSQAEFFLSAATYEGFGLAAAEAMAAGVVPILNAIDAFRALLDNGQAGFLVDYQNIQGAGEQIDQIMNLPVEARSRLSQQARQTAARYAWDVVVPKFERIYQEAIEATKINQ